MLRLTGFWKGYSKKSRLKNAVFLFILFFLLTAALVLLVLRGGTDPRAEYGEIIDEYSEKYGISRSLVYAVMECESGFDEKAVSSAGASGLMQLMPETFDWILPNTGEEERNIFSSRQNTEAGCKYLSYLLKRFELTETALAAYNAGEGNVCLWLGNPEYSSDGRSLKEIPYPETKMYVDRVLRRTAEYERLLGTKKRAALS